MLCIVKTIILLSTLLVLFVSTANAETKREWQCRLAMKEYEMLRIEYLKLLIKENEECSDRGMANLTSEQQALQTQKCTSLGPDRSLSNAANQLLGQQPKEETLSTYEQWITANCFFAPNNEQ